MIKVKEIGLQEKQSFDREIELKEKRSVGVEEAHWVTITSNPTRGKMNMNPLFKAKHPKYRRIDVDNRILGQEIFVS